MRNPQAALIIFLIAIACMTACSVSDARQKPSLSAYAKWAQELPEFPEPDNEDLLNPDYSSFHKKFTPNWFQKIFRPKPLWTPAHFYADLTELDSSRQAKGLRVPHVLAIRPLPGSHFYLWGDLQGAFHSLLRDLMELKRRKIIDDNFVIQKKNTFFVFNGNQINRSPYILETLSLIMTLMKANEGKVIYIAGRHELNNVWQDYGIVREVALRIGGNREDYAQHLRTLGIFFESLPLSLLILDQSEKEIHALNIKAHAKSLEIREEDFASQLDKAPADIPKMIPIGTAYPKADKKLVIDAAVRAISRSATYRVSDGLDLIEPELGAISWTSLSSPTLTYRKVFNFSNDAFCELIINESLKNSVISLIKQDSEKKNGFTTKAYHLLSGKELSEKEAAKPALVSDYHIGFGASFDLSGTSSILGQRVMSGVDLRLRKANRRGDIDGKLLRFYMLDDISSPPLALQNVQRLKDDFGVNALLATDGTNTTEVLLPRIQNGTLTVFFPQSGSNQLRNPKLKNIVNLRTSFSNEACALVRYAKEKLFKNKFAIVYQNDSSGIEPFLAAKNLLKKRYSVRDADICEVPYEPNSINMEAAAEKVASCLPDTILFFSTLTSAQALIHEIGVPFLASKTLMGLSSMTDALRNYAGDSKDNAGKGLNIVISRVVPNPLDPSVEVVRKYKAEMDLEYPGARHNADSLEAYISASILIHAMQALTPPVTPQKIIKRLENLKNYNHQGLKLSFNPLTRELSDHLWLDVGDDKWIKQAPAHTLCDPSQH